MASSAGGMKETAIPSRFRRESSDFAFDSIAKRSQGAGFPLEARGNDEQGLLSRVFRFGERHERAARMALLGEILEPAVEEARHAHAMREQGLGRGKRAERMPH